MTITPYLPAHETPIMRKLDVHTKYKITKPTGTTRISFLPLSESLIRWSDELDFKAYLFYANESREHGGILGSGKLDFLLVVPNGL